MKIIQNALPVGEVLHGTYPYKVVEVLGAGGFGITYKVKASVMIGNVSQTVPFAIKEFFLESQCERKDAATMSYSNPVKENVERSREDFMKEVKRLSSVPRHPGIVCVNEIFEANNTVYYVMEYLGDYSLQKFVSEKRNGRLSEEEALYYIGLVGDAVCHLHAYQTLHLDIKPENMMLKKDPETDKYIPVLIDFGASKHYDGKGRPTSTLNAQYVSAGYSPLEQYVGISSFAPEADVYALGATLYYLLVGKIPPVASEVSETKIGNALPSEISERTKKAVVRAMRGNKWERTPSAAAFLSDLGCSIEKKVIHADLPKKVKPEINKREEVDNPANSGSETVIISSTHKRISWNKKWWMLGTACVLLLFYGFYQCGESKGNLDKELQVRDVFLKDAKMAMTQANAEEQKYNGMSEKAYSLYLSGLRKLYSADSMEQVYKSKESWKPLSSSYYATANNVKTKLKAYCTQIQSQLKQTVDNEFTRSQIQAQENKKKEIDKLIFKR